MKKKTCAAHCAAFPNMLRHQKTLYSDTKHFVTQTMSTHTVLTKFKLFMLAAVVRKKCKVTMAVSTFQTNYAKITFYLERPPVHGFQYKTKNVFFLIKKK
jgi:hypothetical protein